MEVEKVKIKKYAKKHQEKLLNLEKIIGIKFEDKTLLLKSMLHKSYANEEELRVSNERLEFLGDAVLSLVIAENLFKKHKKSNEGKLAKKRATMVSEDQLAKAAHHLGINGFLLLGKGASKEETGKKSNLADFTEAIIGAIYLDRGLMASKKFILERLLIKDVTLDESRYDPKSALQEYTLSAWSKLPHYHLYKTTGPPHMRNFKVRVEINGEIYGKGEGSNKKDAEKMAARKALEKITELEKVES